MELLNEHIADVRFQVDKTCMLKWRAMYVFKTATHCCLTCFKDPLKSFTAKTMSKNFAGWKVYMFQKLHGRLADVRFVSHKKTFLTVIALIAFKEAHHSSMMKKHKIYFANCFDVLSRQKNLFSAWFSLKYWNHGHCFAILSQQAVNWKRNLSFQSVLFDGESDNYGEFLSDASLGREDLPDLVASSADEGQADQNYVELNILLLTGKRLTLNMAVHHTILAVKNKVYLHTGISEEEQRLQYADYWMIPRL